jgi:hypothetical protein
LRAERDFVVGQLREMTEERKRLELLISVAHGKRGKLMEEVGRLQAERSSAWIELTALGDRRRAIEAETSGRSS